MASKSRSDLYAAIRRDHRAGLGKRALMRKYGVGHPTVQKALESAWPQPRKKLPPRATRLDPFKSLVDELLRVDLDAPRKQRHTAKRVFDRLVDEHHANGISYGIVRAYVVVRRGEIRAEAGRGSAEVFVPQSHHPGQEAEVDFGDVTVHLAGQTLVCSLFSLRLSYSGKAVHRVFLCTMPGALQRLARPRCRGRDSAASGGSDEWSRAGPLPEGIARVDRRLHDSEQPGGLGVRRDVDGDVALAAPLAQESRLAELGPDPVSHLLAVFGGQLGDEHHPQYPMPGRPDQLLNVVVGRQQHSVAERESIGEERDAGDLVGPVSNGFEPELFDLSAHAEAGQVDPRDEVARGATDWIVVNDELHDVHSLAAPVACHDAVVDQRDLRQGAPMCWAWGGEAGSAGRHGY